MQADLWRSANESAEWGRSCERKVSPRLGLLPNQKLDQTHTPSPKSIKKVLIWAIFRNSHVRKNFFPRPSNDLKFSDLLEKISEIISLLFSKFDDDHKRCQNCFTVSRPAVRNNDF